jgi:hypothetical protein
MKRTPRRGRIRLQSYIETAMGQRLEAFCAAKGLTEGERVIPGAVLSFCAREASMSDRSSWSSSPCRKSSLHHRRPWAKRRALR